MLKDEYNNHIIGYNYVALIKGILSLKAGKTTLLVNDTSMDYANQWYLNIGYAERSLLLKLGQTLDIEPIVDIDSYLVEQNTLLYLNQKLFEMSDSPYANIKELARKLPEYFSDFFQKELAHLDPKEFDGQFFRFLEVLSDQILEQNPKSNFEELFNREAPKELERCFEIFNQFVLADSLMSKQIHFVVQVLYQTVFSSGHNQLETKYLFLALISPRFQIEGDALAGELLYEYRKLGGDLKDTTISDWGIKDNKLGHILLDSIDGNVKVDHTFFFARDYHHLPFEAKINKTAFKSIVVDCQLEHSFINFFKNKRIVFAPQNRMGSDFPFWELTINDDGHLNGIYSYADFQGTKPSFYYPAALDDIYGSLKMILPGLKKADWVSRAKLSRGKDIWFEFHPSMKNKLLPVKNSGENEFSKIVLKEKKEDLAGISHCGPDRARSLGLYSYFVDVFSN